MTRTATPLAERIAVSCQSCGATLTLAEAYYYETRCEGCEREWSERINAWRTGEVREPELDAFYGAAPETPQESSEPA